LAVRLTRGILYSRMEREREREREDEMVRSRPVNRVELERRELEHGHWRNSREWTSVVLVLEILWALRRYGRYFILSR